jgi:DNA-binding transcriptional LysR family regulator
MVFMERLARIGEMAAMENVEQDVRRLNTSPEGLSKLRWADLRSFLVTARYASLRAAADAQKVSVNTVRAALSRLEDECQVPLIRRSRAGIQLTEAGERLLEQVRDMKQSEPDALVGRAAGDVLVKPGELRIAASEALGSFWLTPRLSSLTERLPDLAVNLQLSYDLAKDRSADHDVGLTYHLPADPDLIVARLATMHIMLFASREYVAEHGEPANLDDMRNHRYVEQVSNGVNSAIVDHIFGQHRPKGFVPIRSNSAITQFWAVERGVGIGAFPTYVSSLTDRLVPIALPFQLRFELYYYYHASAKRSPAVQSAVDWLKEAFAPERHPWFADTFTHPSAVARDATSATFADAFLAGLAAARVA